MNRNIQSGHVGSQSLATMAMDTISPLAMLQGFAETGKCVCVGEGGELGRMRVIDRSIE